MSGREQGLPPLPVDDEGTGYSLWPDSIDFPAGLRTYKRAQFTQELFNRNPRPRRVKRDRSEIHWRVPGGMAGIDGWRSYLFKSAAGHEWVGEVPVLRSNGVNFQDEPGHKRAYNDGAVFVDLLAYRGRAFELRFAEKRNGRWDRYVAWKDTATRPPGYNGLGKQKCASCHNEAGTGGYATGLIAGGDTVFSDPFTDLE